MDIDIFELHKKFRDETLPKWRKLVEDLFPVSIPEMARWTELDDIIKVLDRIGKQYGRNFNHMFFPYGGGLDLTGAKRSIEQGCVELDADGLAYICKPRELTFYAVENEPDWMYFQLDTSPLKDSGVYEDIDEDEFSEELTEVAPGEYADRSVWDYGYYVYDDSGKEERLRKSARVVTRILRGSLVIFCKASWYNLVQGSKFDAYNAIHQKCTAEEFYQLIKKLAKETKELEMK